MEFRAVDKRMREITTAATCSHTRHLPLLTVGHNSSMVFSSGDSLKQYIPNVSIKGTLRSSVLHKAIEFILYFLLITIINSISYSFYNQQIILILVVKKNEKLFVPIIQN